MALVRCEGPVRPQPINLADAEIGKEPMPDVAAAGRQTRRPVSRPSASNRHSSMRVALAEATAMLTPPSPKVAPSGQGRPGEARGDVMGMEPS